MTVAASMLIYSIAPAQDVLQPGRAVAGEIPPGATHRVAVQLGAGDYVTATITRQGRIDLAVVKPDGGLLRRFRAPAVDDTRQIAFVAEPGGGYRIELSNAATTPAKFEIRLDTIEPLAVRLAPSARTDPLLKSHDRSPSKRDRRRHQQHRAILGGRRAQRCSAGRAARHGWQVSTGDVPLARHALDAQRRRARAELGLTHASRQFDAAAGRH